MKKNVGKKDRQIRLVLGLIFSALALVVFSGVIQVVFAVFALVMFFTALTEYCFIYTLLKIDTRKTDNKVEK